MSTPTAPEEPAQPLTALAGALGVDSEAQQATPVAQALSAEEAAPADAGLAHRTTRGLMWFLANVFFGKGLAFVSFVVLGWALTKEDFKVYASAFALAAFAQVFRDGGVIYLIPQRGESEYERIAGPVFWMAFTVNVGVAAFLSLAAWPAAIFLHDHRIAWILWIIAATIPLNTPATIFTAVLQMRLRFDGASRIGIVSSIVRNLTIISLAVGGAGPFSFVIPLVFVAAVEGVMGFALARDKVWLRAPVVAMWGELFRAAKWLILTVIANAGINQGAYLALAALTPKGSNAVGLFFFAYQLVLQVDALLNYAVGFVLLGAFSAIKHDALRAQAAAVRAARALSLIATPATIGLAVVAGPFERLVWGGKWQESVFAIQAIALFCAWRIVFAVPSSATLARGLWRYNAVLLICGGAGTVVAIVVGALIRPDADTAGIAMGAVNLLGLGGLYVLGMRKIGVSARRSIGAVLTVWLIGIAAAGATVWLAHLFQSQLQSLGRSADGVGHRLGHAMSVWFDLEPESAYKLEHRLAIGARAAVELLLMGAVFTKLFLLGLRFMAPATVRDALALSPARLRPHLERLFVIRAS